MWACFMILKSEVWYHKAKQIFSHIMTREIVLLSKTYKIIIIILNYGSKLFYSNQFNNLKIRAMVCSTIMYKFIMW